MSLSFWIFLSVCMLSFYPVLREHRDAWQALKVATGKRDRRTTLTRFIVLWLIPSLTFAGTIVTGFESITTDRETKAQSQKLEHLKQSLGPRTITPEQRSALVGTLRNCPEKHPVVIQASVLDPEAMDFASQIESVLTNSGFSVHLPKGLANDASFAVGPPGLHIAIREPTKPFPSAARLQRSFMSAGFEMPGIATTDCDSNTILICVGQK